MQPLRSINALILDDDQFAGGVVGELLRRRGVDVLRTADKVENAVAFLDSCPLELHLIVVDIYMPGCDGIEFLALLRKRRIGANIVICSSADLVMLTAARQLCSAYGLPFAGILKKPVVAEELDQVLQYACSHAAMDPKRSVHRRHLKLIGETAEAAS
jgi:CheY-like chemotaxis protein